MCGIAGWIGAPEPETVRRMRERLTHRGPDSRGEWVDAERGIWLGHRRLSVLDLSPEGHQPMTSPSGRYVLTYNGEVFNHGEIRLLLEAQGQSFRGHSDTEVLVGAMDAWGVLGAVERLIGMFAFGVYDREAGELWLVRDRLGIKPLYYAQRGTDLAFASELHALRLLPWVDDRLDLQALAAYFRYLCVPGPRTILQGARKLPAGCALRWNGRTASLTRYWDLREVVQRGRTERFRGSFRDAAQELETLLGDAVQRRMQSDVPIGAFLSGGIDSSLVVALMQSRSAQRVQTFTIGFTERSHDESGHARAVAQWIGTDHHEKVLSAREVLDLVPHVTALYDEPFADSSSVPTYLLSRFSRERVTVALSGDGGDELFGGYPRYYWAERIQRWRRALTPFAARVLGRALGSVRSGFLEGAAARVGGRRLAGSEGLAARVRRFGAYLSSPPEQVYQEILSAWASPASLVRGAEPSSLGPALERYAGLSWAEQMMAVDVENYLVDDVLTKVDRASMAVSLEARVPLLDHRVVEWSWTLPTSYRLASDGDRGKPLLREVLYRHVPKHLIERPKMGFGMPLGAWLRQELRPWVEGLLDGPLVREEILDPEPVRAAWREHLAGENRLPQLWTVLAFLQWRQQAAGTGTTAVASGARATNDR